VTALSQPHAPRLPLDYIPVTVYGESAFEFDRMSVTDLLARTGELDRAIQQRYRGERLAREFHECHLGATRLIEGRD
jgi:hypothetical protein